MTPADLLDVTVADVLEMCPAAARTFLDRRMGCVGCPFAAFETVADAALAYGVDALELADALTAAGVMRNHSGGSES